MSNPVAGLDVQIQMDQVLAELKRLSPTMDAEAKQMVAALNRQVKQAEKALKRAADDARKSEDALKRFGKGAGDAGQMVQKLGGLLDNLGLGELARSGGDVGDAFEVAAAGANALLGPLGLLAGAVALGTGVYLELDAALAQVEERNAAVRSELEAVQPVYSALHQAKLDLVVATGELTEAEGADLAVRQKWNETAARSIGLLQAQRAELADKAKPGILDTTLAYWGLKDGVDALAKANADFAGWASPLAMWWTEDAKAGKAAENQMAQLDLQIGKVSEAAEKGAEIDIKSAQARDRRKAATDRAKDAEQELEKALRASQAAMAEDARLDDAYAKGLDGLRAAADDAIDARLSGEAKVRDALEEKLALLEREYQATLALAGTDQQRLEAVAAYEEARVEVARTAENEIDKVREEAAKKQADRQQKLLDDQLAQVNEVGGYVQQGLGLLSDSLDATYQASADNVSRLETQLAASEDYLTNAQKRALEKRIEAQKDAAEQQFEAAKNAKAAEAVASTALAAINAIAQSPPPSPFGLIGAGIATAAGVAAVAEIESQQVSLYTGGLAPDETAATLHRREAVLNGRARDLMGDDAIRDVNAGITAPTSYLLQVRMNHKVLDEPVARTVRAGGELEREIGQRTKAGPAGHGSRA